jgi:opacity protein-like surface antigen
MVAALLIHTPQAQAGGFYASVHGGAAFPEDTDSIFDPGKVTQGTIVSKGDTGFRAGAAFGYALNKYLSVEGEFSYVETDVDTLTSSAAPFGPSPATGTARAYTGMANVYLSLPAGAWRPYVGAGVGGANVKADHIGFAGIPVTTDDSDTAFAWQVMGGVGYHVTPNLELGARYRFMRIDPITLVNSLGDIQAVDNTEVHSVEAVLTYSFDRERDRVPPLK